MKYVSLFSGIEAASVAWQSLDWEPMAFSEIEPFPCELLKQRFPGVPNLGDITKIDWGSYRGAVDVVVGGSPCQSFSIAGDRTGLKGESGLMLEYIRAVREIMPRYFIWENVPGALSCEKGAAFGQLLHEMDDLGYGLAWRVLDAQFFGVPQRRRRVFLVGCLGNVQRAVEILFERESVCWDYQSSREKRKSLADRIKSSIRGCYTMLTRCGCEGGGKGALIQEGVSATLSTSNIQTLFHPLCFPYNVGGYGAGTGISNEVAPTLRAASSGEPAVVQAIDVRNMKTIEELSGTLQAKCNGGYSLNYQNPIFVISGVDYVVRRLTPTECERLQGFPDGYTAINFKGKTASDTARYKAIGNSMAVPVMRWIGERMAMVDSAGE